jgi:thymidylate kinase
VAAVRGRPTSGRFVVVVGPDGTGKSTVVEHLVQEVLDAPVEHLHSRPHVIGGRSEDRGVVTEPHRETPYPVWLSWAKLLFLYADHLVGWFTRIRPHLRAGGDVVLERGWWDLVVDPRRYRLRPAPALARTLGRLLPRPCVTLVLEGDPATIAARKGELSVAETARQMRAWRAVPRAAARPRYLDAARPLPEVRRDAQAAVTAGGAATQIALPRPEDPRWSVPAAPRRATVAGLTVHHPVTRKGLLTWYAARGVAATGAFRLLVHHRVPPPADLVALLAPHVPAGARLAISRGNHEGRCTVLVLDPVTARPLRFIKLALDADGPRSLAREAEAYARFAPLLPAGLDAPEVLVHERHVLVSRAVVAIPRWRPWELPASVAHLLGEFHAGGASAGSGPSHGDCAPWNLLRVDTGWCLVDWADARDDAPPFEDVFHFLTQSHALLGRPRGEQLLRGLRGRGPVGQLLASYARGAGMTTDDVEERYLDHLRRTTPGQDLSRADGRAGWRARTALEARLIGVRG